MINYQPQSTKGRVVCCIGDIHGHIVKLHSLWSNLESQIGSSDFRTALIIFLGDYCDRGPETRSVIDFLISLPSNYPHQSHVFLSGNHDFAFAAFVGVLPLPPNGSPFSGTWVEYSENEEKEGWFAGDGFENMHLQGRRWGGSTRVKEDEKGIVYQGSIYDSRPTFESYGVHHGSADLIKAVPEAHKKFLANMVWVHEEEDVLINSNEEGPKHCKLIAVHAGLEEGVEVERQMELLKKKDTGIPKVANLSGRANVWDIPKELIGKRTMVVSGHHGKVHIEGLRVIIDESGGLENNPIAAIILPSMNIVRDTATAISHI